MKLGRTCVIRLLHFTNPVVVGGGTDYFFPNNHESHPRLPSFTNPVIVGSSTDYLEGNCANAPCTFLADMRMKSKHGARAGALQYATYDGNDEIAWHVWWKPNLAQK